MIKFERRSTRKAQEAIKSLENAKKKIVRIILGK